MTNELIERLRASRYVSDHSAENGQRWVKAPALEIEAADEIERLQRQNDEPVARSVYSVPHAVMDQIYETLKFYANRCSYEPPRIGGVLAGCPRGPEPTREDLIMWAVRTLAVIDRDVLGRAAQPPPTVIQCTGGCCGKICGSFVEQDDGERRVDYSCATCGHTRECHEPVSAPPPGEGPEALVQALEVLRQRWSHNVNFEATIGACKEEIELCISRAASTKESAP